MEIVYTIIGMLGWIFICSLYIFYAILVWYCIDLFYKKGDNND